MTSVKKPVKKQVKKEKPKVVEPVFKREIVDYFLEREGNSTKFAKDTTMYKCKCMAVYNDGSTEQVDKIGEEPVYCGFGFGYDSINDFIKRNNNSVLNKIWG